MKVVKNKVAPPFKQAEFDIAYGEGISWEGSVLDVALEHKVIQKSGSYFSFGDERLGQGRTNVKAFMVEHPDVTTQGPGRDPGRRCRTWSCRSAAAAATAEDVPRAGGRRRRRPRARAADDNAGDRRVA